MPHVKLPVPDRFRRLIAEGMKKQDLSMRQLASSAGLSPSFLSRILAGERGLPTEKTIRRLARALNLDADQLLIAGGRTPASLKAVLEQPVMPELLRAAGDLTEEQRQDVLVSIKALIMKHHRSKDHEKS